MKDKIKKECYGCSMTGVRRAVIYNQEAVVIFHSPEGCGQVIREKDGRNANHLLALMDEVTVPIFTTNISDTDVVFGATKRLEECLEYVIKNIAPKYVVVGNSCVAGIIGDDIASTVKMMREKFSVPIFTVASFGFMNGGYEEGFIEITKALLEHYVKSSSTKKKEITLIGFVEKNNSQEYAFIKGILEEWLYNINCVFPGAASIEQMTNIAHSKACIMCGTHSKVNNAYRRVAGIINEKYNIPIIKGPVPVGRENSLSWIKIVGQRLNVAGPLIKDTIERKNQEFNKVYEEYKNYFVGKKCIIYVNRMPEMNIDINWFFELLEIVGIVVIKILFNKKIVDKTRTSFVKNLIPDGHERAIGEFSHSLIKDVDYVFSIRMEGIGKEQFIAIPYVNPPFDVRGIKEYLSRIFKVEMKKIHRG